MKRIFKLFNLDLLKQRHEFNNNNNKNMNFLFPKV